MNATVLPLKLTCRAFVSLPGVTLADLDKLTPGEVSTIGAKLTDDEWEVVSCERMGGFEVDLSTFEDAELLPTAGIAKPSGKPSIKVRAAEIGVTIQTLYRWQREDGIDVFDDNQVRSLIGRRRNHLWQVNDKFKARMPSNKSPSV